MLITCPACGGDGRETCNNPDHGFIGAMGGDIGRLGCPGCIHGNPKHPTFKCDTCGGTGQVSIEVAKFHLGDDFEEFVREHDFDKFVELEISR